MGTCFSNLDFWFQGKFKKVVPAQTLWFDILKAQIETGTPYMLYKVYFWHLPSTNYTNRCSCIWTCDSFGNFCLLLISGSKHLFNGY